MAETVDLGWSVIEMMGHRVIAGFVSEVEIAGAGFLRVDLWAEDGAPKASQFIAPQAVYCLTPTTEEAVRELMQPRPVHRFLYAGNSTPDAFDEEDDDDDPDDAELPF